MAVFRSEDGGRPETIDRVRIALLHNEGNGLFVEHASVIQAENPQKTKGGGAIFGDYDNDGDLDIFVPVGAFWSDQSAPNMLLRNDRGVFSDVAQVAELTNDSVSDDAIWLDYDHDGNLDLYVANMGCFPPDTTAINRLYRNLGDGRFEDVTEALGVGGVWRKDDVCAVVED